MANEVVKKESKIQHVWLSAGISKKMEDVFIGFILNQAQNNEGVTEYVVYLSTLGGSPFSAIDLYNFIKSIPQKTTVYNMGNVYSAGVPFFLSFDKRIGVPDSNFMIHQTTLPRETLPESFNLYDLETQKRNLLAIDQHTQKIIHKETSQRAATPMTPKSIHKAAQSTTTFGTKEALDHGFIDKIETPQLPETGVLYITDQYLATLEG